MSKALDAIVGETPAIIALRALVRSIAPTRLSVLVEGPTGSGKELVAAAIHDESGRSGRFVPFNICAIPESLFEDALFGHVRGAFTGAIADAPGYLREANGGTVFLDELGGLQPSLQIKLLRALETGEFRPGGAHRDVRSDFRAVAATNERAADLVAARRLRPDLAHRIAGATIVVPPLCDRVADIPLLAEHFAKRAGMVVRLDDATVAALSVHRWPGNVRELRNVVERARALGGLTEPVISTLLATVTPTDEKAAAIRGSLREVLDAHGWKPRSAARALGVHYTTVYRWMKESGISPPPAA